MIHPIHNGALAIQIELKRFENILDRQMSHQGTMKNLLNKSEDLDHQPQDEPILQKAAKRMVRDEIRRERVHLLNIQGELESHSANFKRIVETYKPLFKKFNSTFYIDDLFDELSVFHANPSKRQINRLTKRLEQLKNDVLDEQGNHLSDLEYSLLSNLNPEFKYIARDPNTKYLMISTHELDREISISTKTKFWTCDVDLESTIQEYPYHHLFQFISNKDTQPYRIRKLIAQYERKQEVSE